MTAMGVPNRLRGSIFEGQTRRPLRCLAGSPGELAILGDLVQDRDVKRNAVTHRTRLPGDRVFMSARDELKSFMEPRSIALVGVPRRTGRLSLNILENLLEYGYKGKVYPVNPHAREIAGVKVYPALEAVPDEIDLALIATPRPSVLPVVQECARKRIKAVAILTQGFADFDEGGKAMEEEMVRMLRGAGSRLLGPNTLGVANAYIRLNTSFARPEVTEIPVGVIAQTGSFFTGTQRFLPSGKSIDLGNTSDVDFCDALEYFEDDLETKVIGLYVEGIRNGRRFREVARRVAMKKPVIALKSGRSRWGLQAARSHTAQLTGSDHVYDAAFRQCGVMRAADIEEQGDLARAFCRLPLMRGKGLGVVTMSGSAGVLAADACQDHGLEMAHLLPETKAAISEMSLPWVNIQNPVDVWPAIFSETKSSLLDRYMRVSRDVLEKVAGDPTVDGILFIAGVMNPRDVLDPTEVVVEIAEAFPHKPIVCMVHGRNSPAITERLERTEKTVVFPSCERAVRALGRLRKYAEFREKEHSL